MTSWVIQRSCDDQYYNGFKRDPWSKSIVCALAFASKQEAKDEMAAKGWQSVVYLLLPEARRTLVLLGAGSREP